MKTILSVIGAISVLLTTLLFSLMLYLNITFEGWMEKRTGKDRRKRIVKVENDKRISPRRCRDKILAKEVCFDKDCLEKNCVFRKES